MPRGRAFKNKSESLLERYSDAGASPIRARVEGKAIEAGSADAIPYPSFTGVRSVLPVQKPKGPRGMKPLPAALAASSVMRRTV